MRKMRVLVVGLACVWLAAPAWALEEFKPLTTLQDAAVATGNGTVIDVALYNTIALDVSIATTATVTFEGTVDGSTWVSRTCVSIADTSGTLVTSTTSSGEFQCNVAGLAKFQAPISAWTSGAVTVKARATTADMAGGGGGGGGGGTQYVEDTAHNSGDTGTMVLCVRRDANTTLADTTGDYAPCQVDSSGNIKMNLATCLSGESGCIATSPNSYIMVTGATAKLTAIATGVTTNTTSATFAVPSGAKTFLAKVEGTGAITQTWTIYGAYDTTATLGDSLCVITLSATTKDYGTCDSGAQVSKDYAYYYYVTTSTTGTGATGELVVYTGLVGGGGTGGAGDASAANQTTMITALQLIDNIVGTEDAGETAGGGLAMAGSVRRDTMASSAGTTGDNATVNTDANGLLWSRTADPCSALAKTYLPISISTATTTEITPSLAGASTHYYICSLNLVTTAANNVLVADDDSDGCGSPTSGIFGSDGTPAAAEGWNFAANSGIAIGSGSASVGRTGGTNRVICIITSAATQLSGMMTVVAAP